jgi:hypothetical protein
VVETFYTSSVSVSYFTHLLTLTFTTLLSTYKRSFCHLQIRSIYGFHQLSHTVMWLKLDYQCMWIYQNILGACTLKSTMAS